jgi:general secretion pathway protein K
MVIVIWVLSLLTIMAGSFALTMRRESTVISAVKDNARVQAMAETGISIAQQMLFLDDKERRWRADGSIYTLKYEQANIRVRLISELGKIDINKANEELLTAMMGATTLELAQQQEIVSAILDWRDKDDLVHINGAEQQQYEEAGLLYSPANQDFQLIDELQMVLGMNSEIYLQLKPLITVYSKQPQVDLNVASKEVLSVISNLDDVALEEYIQQRTENNKAQMLVAGFPLAGSTGKNQGGSDNQVYTIISQAQLLDEFVTGIKATIRKSDSASENPIQILNWQQIDQKKSLFDDDMTQLLVTQDEP